MILPRLHVLSARGLGFFDVVEHPAAPCGM